MRVVGLYWLQRPFMVSGDMPVLQQLSPVPAGTSFLLITCGANYLEGFKADVGARN